MRMRSSLALAASLVLALSARAATYHVASGASGDGSSPANAFGTIAAALSVADDGDVILVQSGTHTASGLELRKAVTLRGATGNAADVTVRGSGCLLKIYSMQARVEAMTFTSSNSHAVYLEGGVLANCVVQGCNGGGTVGGILMKGASADLKGRVESCIIRNNFGERGDVGGGGGGIHIDGWGVVSGCMISNNVTRTSGGGVVANSANALIENSVIYNNWAGYSNSNRTSGGWGGGAGAVYKGTYVNCLIAENTGRVAAGNGTTYDGTLRDATLYHCTVVGNRYLADSGRVYGGLYSCTAYNSIILGNEGSDSASPLRNFDASSQLYSCIAVPEPKPEDTAQADRGNLWQEIDLVQATLATPLGYATEGFVYPFKITASSPALNAGDTAYLHPDETVDIRGLDRVNGAGTCIGCYEVQSASPIITTLTLGATTRTVTYEGEVFTLGSDGVEWATLRLVVSRNEDLSSPVYEADVLTATADRTAYSGTVTGLDPLTTYYARITARNSLGETGVGMVNSVTTIDPAMELEVSNLGLGYHFPSVTMRLLRFAEGATALTNCRLALYREASGGDPLFYEDFAESIVIAPSGIKNYLLKVHGLLSGTDYWIDFITTDDAGTTVPLPNRIKFTTPARSARLNVWANTGTDMADAGSYLYNWVPEPADTLFFELPPVTQPTVSASFAAPSLHFGRSGDTSGNYPFGSPNGYDIQGDGELVFTSGGKIVTARAPGLNRISAAIRVDCPATVKELITDVAYCGNVGSQFEYAGPITFGESARNLCFKVTPSSSSTLYLSNEMRNFAGTFFRSDSGAVAINSPTALAGLTLFESDNAAYYTNGTETKLDLSGATLLARNSGIKLNGAPFVFGRMESRMSGSNWTLDTDLTVGDLIHSSNSASPSACPLLKQGEGLFHVTGNVMYEHPGAINWMTVQSGCLALTGAGTPPGGRIGVSANNNCQTVGIKGPYKPNLAGGNDLTVYALGNTPWGLTAFGGSHEVCIGNDPDLNARSVKFTSSETVYDTSSKAKALSDCWAAPSNWAFGHASEEADGTILFKNRLEYTNGSDGNIYVQSHGHTVAARLQGDLVHPDSAKTWYFKGRNGGGYLALEKDATLAAKVAVSDKANLLVNCALTSGALTVNANSGLGGTGTVSAAVTVNQNGELFGGEYGAGGSLKIAGALTLNAGAALRVEIPTGTDPKIGCIELVNSDETKSLSLPATVRVRLDARQSTGNKARNRVKILDWYKASFKNGATPAATTFTVEAAEGLFDSVKLVKDEAAGALYLAYKFPKRSTTVIIIR